MTELRDPVARDCFREHASLNQQLARMEKLVRAPDPAGADALREQLRDLRDVLSRHMASEEKPDGFMDQVRRRTARYDAALKELRDEHRSLSTGLDTLIAEAADFEEVPGPFASRLRSWSDTLRDHESRENHLLQAAFTVDLGAKD